MLLNYAVEIEMITNNPAVGIKPYRSRKEGFHAWNEAEAAQFEAAHSVGTRARLAFTLALYTGQRVSDVVRMGWQHVKGDRIAVRQQKTDKFLLIKMHPELVRVLASVPQGNLTFLLTDRGAPFTPAGLSNWFGKRCREAGLRNCSAHGLRKLALTRRANAGASTDMLKAFGGHETSKEVERYTREADQARLDEQGLELAIEGRAGTDSCPTRNPAGQKGCVNHGAARETFDQGKPATDFSGRAHVLGAIAATGTSAVSSSVASDS